MIDICIIILFFVISFLIGILASKGIKNFTQFSVGHRSFSSFVIFSTLSASFIGGGYTIGNAAKVYEVGLIYTVGLLGFSLKEILIGLFIAPKMAQHCDCLSVGDIIYKKYGVTAKIFTGILSVFLCTGILGAQVGGMAAIFNAFFDFQGIWAVITAFVIMIAYSAIGGMRAVVFTDVFQFLVLIIGIPVTFFIGIQHVGGFSAIEQAVPHKFINFLQTKHDIVLLVTLFITFIFGETLVPPYVQRLFMAKNVNVTKRAIISSGVISIPFFLIAGGIGLIAYTMTPSISSNQALIYVVKHVLPVGVKGFVIAALLAIIISSASSFLNSAAIAAVNDIAKPLVRRKIPEKTWLIIAKVCTLFIGFGAVFFALTINNILDILLYAYNFWSPIILVPLVIALTGIKAKKLDFFTSAIGGIIGSTIWSIVLHEPWGISGVVAGLLCSLASYTVGRLCSAKQHSLITK